MRKMSRMAACVYATANGYFWLPCPVCGEEFGGHEWGDRGGHDSTIPDEPYGGGGTGICPNCAISGTGCYVHARLRGVAYHDCEHTLRGLKRSPRRLSVAVARSTTREAGMSTVLICVLAYIATGAWYGRSRAVACYRAAKADWSHDDMARESMMWRIAWRVVAWPYAAIWDQFRYSVARWFTAQLDKENRE